MKKKYKSEVYKKWYELNKVRIRDSKKTSKKKYRRTEAGRAAQRRYNAKPSRKLYVKNYRLKKFYGITINEYNALFEKQFGRCLICRNTSKTKLHVDHSHSTGKVRGLLCGSCNRAIGLFNDDVLIIESAVSYLKNV